MQPMPRKCREVLSTAIASVSLLALVPAAQALVIAYDHFDYGATGYQLWGPQPGGPDMNGGTGWGGNWTARGGNGSTFNQNWACSYDPAGNLSIPGLNSLGGGITQSVIAGTGGGASDRNLATALSSGTYYIGMNVELDTRGYNNNGWVGGRFIPQGVYDSEFCPFGLRGNADGTTASLFVGNQTGTTTFPLGAGSLQRIVLKLNLNSNTAQLFSVPDVTTFAGNENIYNTGLSFSFNRGNYYNQTDPTQYPWLASEIDFMNGATGKADEYRIATNFYDVLGLPPPPLPYNIWSADGNGDWANSGNWSKGVPNAVGAEAYFNDVLSTSRVVYTNSNVTVGTLNLYNGNSYFVQGAGNLTFSASGSATLTVLSGNHYITPAQVEFASNTNLNINGSITLAGTLNGVVVDAGKTVTVNDGGNVTILGKLHLNGTGTQLAFAPKAAGLVGAILTLDHTSAVMGTGTIDISSNNVIVHGATDAEVITNLLNNGKLTSSAVSANPGIYALGVLKGSDYKAGNRLTLGAYTVQDSDAVVRYTYAGDINLDGKITPLDLAQIDAAYLSGLYTSGGATWINGDSNYDGIIDAADFALIDAAFSTYYNYGSPIALARAQADAVRFGDAFTAVYDAAISAVPEPASLSLLGLGAVALLKQRK